MKIIFNRQQIINTVSPLLCAVTNKPTMPAIECILMEAKTGGIVTLTTFDLEKGVRCDAEATVLEEGFFAVNAQKFYQTVKVMEGETVTLTVNEKFETTIESGRSSYKMSALPGADFPVIPSLKSEMSFEIPAVTLRKMISKIAFAMGVSDQRPVLNGAFFKVTDNEILAVSCDSFKMAKCVCRINPVNRNSDGAALRYQYIVPQKTVNELARMLPDGEDESVVIYIQRKNMVYVFGGLIFFTRLIEGEYIDYERIIIKNHPIKIVADRDAFLSALERAAIVTEEKIAGSIRTPLKFTAEGDELKITAASSAGSSYDEMCVEHTGNDIVIGFNNRFLIDAVRVCECERIRIELSSPLNSINIVPDDASESAETDDLFFLLPVKMRS